MDHLVGLNAFLAIGKFVLILILLWWLSTSVMPWTILVIRLLTGH